MNDSQITTDGLRDGRPGREATVGVNVPPGGGGPRRKRRHDEPQFRSYYGQPILNKPVWEAPDIPGYFFLGGLAGAGAVLAAAATTTKRPRLATVSKVGAAVGGQLSVLALIHDLGRRRRFLNMLRMFKVTSPMSVGSWLLAAFVPASTVAAFTAVTGRMRPLGMAGTAGAAALGPAVATYTAVLAANTAVPAWHDGYREMPFVFAASGLSAAAGLGMLAAPTDESAPLRPLAAGAAAAELALSKGMEKRMGMVGEAYHEQRAGKYMKAAEALMAGGAALAATAGRSRARNALAGTALLAGSALTRFGIFQAGLNSAEDPKYTVVPQRQRLERAKRTEQVTR